MAPYFSTILHRWMLLLSATAVAGIAYAGWIWMREENRAPVTQTHSVQIPIPSSLAKPAPEPQPMVDTEVTTAASPAKKVDPRLLSAGFNELLAMFREQLASGTAMESIVESLQTIAETRPALAIELILGVARTEEEKADWLTGVMKTWAIHDCATAFQWITSDASRFDQLANGNLISVIFDQMALERPDLIVEKANASLLLGDLPNRISPAIIVHAGLEALIKSGHGDDAKKALEEWAHQTHSAEIGPGAYESVARYLMLTSPDVATAWLKSLPANDDRNSAMTTLAGEWAQRDPAAAMAWCESLPPEQGGSESMEKVFCGWMEKDLSGAAQWLDHHRAQAQDGPQTDAMIGSLVSASPLIQSDPQVVLEWARLIENTELRAQVIAGVVMRWASRDLNAANEYAARSAELTAMQKEQLLRSLRNPLEVMDAGGQ